MFEPCLNYATMFDLCLNYVSSMIQLCFNYDSSMIPLRHIPGIRAVFDC